MATEAACDEALEMEMMDEDEELLERSRVVGDVGAGAEGRGGPGGSRSGVELRAGSSVRVKRVTRFETRSPENASTQGGAGSGYYKLRQPHSDSNLRSKRLLDHRLATPHPSEVSSGMAPTLSLLNDEPVESQLSPYVEDLCQLCKSHQSGESGGVGLELDERPGVIRWRKLPCRCPDRYLHVACLETGFFEDAIYSAGRRRLPISCSACGDRFLVTHHRGRRLCDGSAWTSFARHLLLAGVTSGALIGFGLWSMLHPVEGRPRLVNSAMVGAGCLILVAFALYEVWLLYCRYEFQFNRVDAAGKQPEKGGAT